MNGSDAWHRHSPPYRLPEKYEKWRKLNGIDCLCRRRRRVLSFDVLRLIWSEYKYRISIRYTNENTADPQNGTASGETSILLCFADRTKKNAEKRGKKICFNWWCCHAIIFAPEKKMFFFPSCIHYSLVVRRRRRRLNSFVSHFAVRQSSENQDSKNLVFHSLTGTAATKTAEKNEDDARKEKH